MNVSSIARLGFSLALFSSFAQASVLVEGADPAMLQKHAETLKSVVKLQMLNTNSIGVCSSALIGENLLLTAKHCVEDEFKVLLINGIATPSIEVIMSAKTDIAMIRFKATEELTQAFKDIKPLKVSFKGNADIQDEVLIAGYGITSPDDQGAREPLHAGVNYLVEAHDLLKQQFKLANSTRPKKERITMSSRYLHVYGMRKESKFHELTQGQQVSFPGETKHSVIESKEAVPLSGDSGGPLIAFDASGTPVVVGVASEACTDVYDVISNVVVSTASGSIPPITETMDLMTMLNLMAAGGLLNEQAIATIPFSFQYDQQRIAAGVYESTDFGKNAAFIQSQLPGARRK